MNKVLLLGASGYIGGTFKAALVKRNYQTLTPARDQMNYCKFEVLRQYIQEQGGIDFLINAAGFTGKPNVEQCEIKRGETIQGNLLLPQMLSHLAALEDFRWLQIGTGCIYNGDNDGKGYTEEDKPNFSFKYNNCSFYSGVKGLAEDYLKTDSNCYICRLRIPFDNIDNSRNYISKLINYEITYNNINSISHIEEFVDICIGLYERNCPTGIYNICNENGISTKEVVDLIKDNLIIKKEFKYFKDDSEFYKVAKVPRSNCVLNVNKIKSMGFKIRTAKEAVLESLQSWEKSY